VALQAIQLPTPPRGFGTSTAEVVSDGANVITPAVEDHINRIAFDVHAKSGGEITVVTLPDIGDRAESDVALQIGRQWKIGRLGNPGDATRNSGAVILVVPKESSADNQGKCFIATGRGAEGFITDAMSGDMCREAVPLFRQGDYSGAIDLLTVRVAERFAREFNFTLDTTIAAPSFPVQEPASTQFGRASRRGGINPIILIVLFFVVFSFLSSLGGRRRRRGCGGCLPIFLPMGGGGFGGFGGGGRGWGGGGFGGGGFGGGGGGGFGGFGGGGGFSGGGGGSRW
jgi:uncharacterized protein